jgi:hypothetical protein
MEVADATLRAGLNRQTAGEVMRRLIPLLDGQAVEAPNNINECYDLVYHRPKPDYQAIYESVKEEFSQGGLNFG